MTTTILLVNLKNELSSELSRYRNTINNAFALRQNFIDHANSIQQQIINLPDLTDNIANITEPVKDILINMRMLYDAIYNDENDDISIDSDSSNLYSVEGDTDFPFILNHTNGWRSFLQYSINNNNNHQNHRRANGSVHHTACKF